MRYSDLPTVRLFELAEDLRRFSREYQWESGIIIKVLRRTYGIELTIAELDGLKKKLGM